MAGGRTYHKGQQVKWVYRSAMGYGTIDRILTQAGNADTWRYRVRVNDIDRQAHRGEPAYRVHTGADISAWDGKLPASVVAQAKANRAKK